MSSRARGRSGEPAGADPPVADVGTRTVTSVQLSAAARHLAEAAGRLGLRVPAFRAPPRVVGVDRTVRRRGEHVTVAVRLHGRPFPAVLADLVEGVIVANRLDPVAAGRARSDLWEALEPIASAAA